MHPTDSDIVFQSYGRCCTRDMFFVDFYDRFMNSSNAIRERFKNTDMAQQRHLLRNGIMQLILYARGAPDTKLRALGESHSRTGYNIPAEWYDVWMEALMATVKQHDPEFEDGIEQSWRRALQPGVDLIRNAY